MHSEHKLCTVHCTVYTGWVVHCALYSEHCALYSVHRVSGTLDYLSYALSCLLLTLLWSAFLLHCTALHCTALNCAVLHWTVLYCTALYFTVPQLCTAQHQCFALNQCSVPFCISDLHCTLLECTALHSRDCCMERWVRGGGETGSMAPVQYSTVQYSTVQYSTVHYNTVQYSTVQYSTVQYSTLHYTTLHYTTLHYTTLHYTTLHYTTVPGSMAPYLGRGQGRHPRYSLGQPANNLKCSHTHQG